MNTQKFSYYAKGEYGRKIAYVNYENVNINNVAKILEETLPIFEANKRLIDYLWNYYKGDQPIKYRRKLQRDDINNIVCENRAYEIVQYANGQTYGEPVLFNSRKEDETINKAVDTLNDYMVDVDKHGKDVKGGEWKSAVGTSFKAIQYKQGADIPFRIVVPSPMTTYIAYSSTTQEPLLAVQEMTDTDNNKYYVCFSDNAQFIVKGGVVVNSGLHIYGGIPIVEYPNNHERISDIELVVDLLDAINVIQSNRVDGIEQFIQAWIKFKNCDVDSETFEEMKKMGALLINSATGNPNADADILTAELNQEQTEIFKEDIWDSILSILAIPNKQGNTGGDTQGAVELRNGHSMSKARGKLKDAMLKHSDKQLAQIILNILDVENKGLGITLRDFDVQINHSPSDNLIVRTQALQYLLTCGIHPLVAIKTVGLWGDSEKTYLLSKPYLDKLYSALDDETKAQENKALQLYDDFKV